MKLMQAIIGGVVALLVLSGCTSTSGVMPFSQDTYTVVQRGQTGFTSTGALKTAAYKEANDFAQRRGKQIEITEVIEKPAGFAKWPQVEVKFRLLDKK